MIIKDISLYQYDIALSSFLKRREGVIIKVHSETHQGIAEVSPLPGRSLETLSQSTAQLIELRERLLGLPITIALEKVTTSHLLAPSVSYGLFSALNECIQGQRALTVNGCALLYGNYKQMTDEVSYVRNHGFKVVKIKTSAICLQELEKLLTKIPSHIRVRLDGNRSWDAATAREFTERFDLRRFEYIEEPFKDADLLYQYSLPIALDESCEDLRLQDSLSLSKARAMVFKPMVQGFGPRARERLATALRMKATVTLSSSLESGAGLYQLAALCHYLNMEEHYMGIDTYKLLKEDILIPPPVVHDGKLNFRPLEIAFHRLKKIPITKQY